MGALCSVFCGHKCLSYTAWSHVHCSLIETIHRYCSLEYCYFCSGKCICEICSKDKMRVPKIDEKRLFRVCNPCGKELKSMRVYGVQHRDEDD